MTMTQNFPQFQQQQQPMATVKPERIEIPSYHAQPQTPSAPPPPGYGGVPAKNTKPPVTQTENEENIESLPDFQSIKGVFGWTTIDQVNIPYILRHDEQFVSVRIVELKLLSKYPNSYPDDLGKHAPLTSYFITANEAKLLNEINLTHCGGEYGKKEFNTKDLIVLLTDFNHFFKLVKKTFPDGGSAPAGTEQPVVGTHGWMQIKNTVSPYVNRQDGKYVPLSVMQHAAGLVKQGISGVNITVPEKDVLNKACKAAGVNFQFSENTKLIKIDQILGGVHTFKELPANDPLKHAHYMELPTSNSQGQVNTAKATYQSQPQKQTTNPYQFQQRLPQMLQGRPTVRQQLEVRQQMQAQIPNDSTNPRINQQHMNRPPPRYPFPPNPMFDMRMPGMFGPPGRFPQFFPQANGMPNGPPLPPGFPNVSAMNSMPHMNPLAQYYMENGKNQAGTNLTRAAPPPHSPVINQSMNGFDPNKRSPGAQSTTPSPRSRHTSGSRPPSGSRPSSTSRPPSETPLSPTNFALPPFPNGPIPNQISPFPFPPGQTIPHLQGMVQGLQPNMPPVNSASQASNTNTVNSNIPVAHQNGPSSGQSQKINGHVTPSENSNQTAQQSIRSPNSANQVVSESRNRTGPVPVELNLSQPKPSDKTNSGSAPPPLLRMGDPKPVDKVTPVGAVPVSLPVSSNSVPVSIKNQPVPKTVSAVAAAPTLPSSFTDSIKGAWLNNKSISCLHLDKAGRKGRYCLVEAVCKLYFNGYSVLEFLFALEKVLNVSLVICNDEEEKAFIQYYSLPVEVLKCNKMIEFDDLKKFFPQLSYMFPDKNAPDLNIALDNSGGDSVEDNNNIDKLLTNGLMSADDLEAGAMPVTVNQISNRQGDKRPRESPTVQPSKQAKLDHSSGENDDDDDDAVIILD